MLTIGALASYAGVTTRAVRHYHRVGLLPEPPRDASGYRSYDAAAVVRLIKIRTLAEAGVPLARVRELLDADQATFDAALVEIDTSLARHARTLQQRRCRIAALSRPDRLGLPESVVDYLERLRDLGAPEELIAGERDAWLMMAAHAPDSIEEVIADKAAQLSNPKVVHLYGLLGRLAKDSEDDALLNEVADVLSDLFEEAAESGTLDHQEDHLPDPVFVGLLDAFAEDLHPVVARLRELIAERGWSGWTVVERNAH